MAKIGSNRLHKQRYLVNFYKNRTAHIKILLYNKSIQIIIFVKQNHEKYNFNVYVITKFNNVIKTDCPHQYNIIANEVVIKIENSSNFFNNNIFNIMSGSQKIICVNHVDNHQNI